MRAEHVDGYVRSTWSHRYVRSAWKDACVARGVDNCIDCSDMCYVGELCPAVVLVFCACERCPLPHRCLFSSHSSWIPVISSCTRRCCCYLACAAAARGARVFAASVVAPHRSSFNSGWRSLSFRPYLQRCCVLVDGGRVLVLLLSCTAFTPSYPLLQSSNVGDGGDDEGVR